MLLKGKTAIITGATRGIGKKIAEVFAENGANLILSGRSELTKETFNTSEKIVYVKGDITNDEHIKEIVKTCKDNFETLDILVNNAGIFKRSLIGMATNQVIRETFESNIFSAINLTQYAVKLMTKSSLPSIINISSIVAVKGGGDGVSVYSASKNALVGFTLSAAKELAAKKIRVNAIAPGFIDTDMTKELKEEKREEHIKNIKLGRIGTPLDVANCALFLASDLSSYITGQVIGVDGGLLV